MCERERERCVCVCVCEREREREVDRKRGQSGPRTRPVGGEYRPHTGAFLGLDGKRRGQVAPSVEAHDARLDVAVRRLHSTWKQLQIEGQL